MGYNVRVTRGDWSEEDPHRITYEEWRLIAEDDSEFEECGHQGSRILYCWKVHPDKPCFIYSDGSVVVRYRDEAIFRKMLHIADKLGAVVQGEEGEYYRLTERGVEQTWEEPDPGSSPTVP